MLPSIYGRLDFIPNTCEHTHTSTHAHIHHSPLWTEIDSVNCHRSYAATRTSHDAGVMQNREVCRIQWEVKCNGTLLTKIKPTIILWPSNPMPVYPKEMKIFVTTQTCMQAFATTSRIISRLQRDQCPSTGKWIKTQAPWLEDSMNLRCILLREYI